MVFGGVKTVQLTDDFITVLWVTVLSQAFKSCQAQKVEQLLLCRCFLSRAVSPHGGIYSSVSACRTASQHLLEHHDPHNTMASSAQSLFAEVQELSVCLKLGSLKHSQHATECMQPALALNMLHVPMDLLQT